MSIQQFTPCIVSEWMTTEVYVSGTEPPRQPSGLSTAAVVMIALAVCAGIIFGVCVIFYNREKISNKVDQIIETGIQLVTFKNGGNDNAIEG